MTALGIGAIVFACVFAGAVLGMVLSSILPKEHLSDNAKDVIKVTMAMIVVLPPATARLIALAGQQEHFLLLQTLSTALFVLWCVIADWRKYGKVHPIYSIGGTLLVLSWPFRLWFAQTDAWAPVGLWMAEVGRRFGA